MGTNYYLHTTKGIIKKSPVIQHIGKKSAGWKFTFHWIEGVAESVPQWMELTQKGRIIDEYGRKLSWEDFWDIVQQGQVLKGYQEWAQKEIENGNRLVFLFKDSHVEVDGYDFTKGEFR